MITHTLVDDEQRTAGEWAVVAVDVQRTATTQTYVLVRRSIAACDASWRRVVRETDDALRRTDARGLRLSSALAS